jgi:hypothetical protein
MLVYFDTNVRMHIEYIIYEILPVDKEADPC